ncbi:MAG: GNAT family N-acetyltransferase [Ktedonobacteraceae bacterium]|nr:GNAT family N-acetyltransferase [Ktedonobacteraceae bacterium]
MASIFVRPATTSDELKLQFHLGDQAFSQEPSPESAERWQKFVTSSPDFRSEEIRGAFRDMEQLGGFIIYERKLCMGKAQLTTGCISAVVTHPTYRHLGVARVMMQDAIDYALVHKHALLLLDGIPKFYYRFGYTDMFDLSIQDIKRSAVLALPSSSYSIRPGTIEDASSVLALYQRQYYPYTGSFVRTLERQMHLMQYRTQLNPLLLAIDPSGNPKGYLMLSRGEEHPQALEVGADDWQATVALLQYHAKLFSGTDAPEALRYRLPARAPVLQWMIDNLEVPDTTMWKHPADEWGVRSQAFHHRYTGWMARLIHLPTLAHEMLPEWQARWQRALAHWSGTLSLTVDDTMCTLSMNGSELTLLEGQSNPSTYTLDLTMQEFVQILFGYRPVSLLLATQSPSDDLLLSILTILFPTGHTWIPSSDGF